MHSPPSNTSRQTSVSFAEGEPFEETELNDQGQDDQFSQYPGATKEESEDVNEILGASNTSTKITVSQAKMLLLTDIC